MLAYGIKLTLNVTQWSYATVSWHIFSSLTNTCFNSVTHMSQICQSEIALITAINMHSLTAVITMKLMFVQLTSSFSGVTSRVYVAVLPMYLVVWAIVGPKIERNDTCSFQQVWEVYIHVYIKTHISSFGAILYLPFGTN